jgi:hemoglobin
MILLRTTTIALVLLTGATASAQTKPKTLYERLGGYDTIAKITDAVFPKLILDPVIKPVVDGLADTSRQRNRQLIVDQLCHEAGGPCLYIGRTMEASHQGLGITEQMWTNMMKLLSEALTTLNVKEPERSEFTAIFAKFKDGIVQQPKK